MRRDPTRRWVLSGREVPWAYGWKRPANAPGAERLSTSGYDIHDALIFACGFIAPRSYLEIGVDGGGSFFAVLEAAEIEYAVLCDVWNPDYCKHGLDGHEHIERQLQGRGLKRVQFLDGDSRQKIPELSGQVFDLITVDGGHTEEIATADLENCWPLLREGGMLAFDDVGHTQYPHLEGVFLAFMGRHSDAVLIPEVGADWRNCALVAKL